MRPESSAAQMLDGIPRPAKGWMMSVEECFEKAREAPGYTTFELALVCLAHHYAELTEASRV